MTQIDRAAGRWKALSLDKAKRRIEPAPESASISGNSVPPTLPVSLFTSAPRA